MSEFAPVDGDSHVISIEESHIRVPGRSDKMLTIADTSSSIEKQIINQNLPWLNAGVKCKLLRLGNTKWITGTVKFRLKLVFEFKPDDDQD